MILEEIKIEGKGRVQVTACLCGSPRIKPLVHMEVWANETFTDKTHCQVTVDDHRLIRGNRIMLVLINTSDDIVTLPASSCVAFAKVKEANENSLRSQPLVPNRTLLFL